MNLTVIGNINNRVRLRNLFDAMLFNSQQTFRIVAVELDKNFRRNFTLILNYRGRLNKVLKSSPTPINSSALARGASLEDCEGSWLRGFSLFKRRPGVGTGVGVA